LILASAAALGLGLLLTDAAWLDRGLRVVCGGYLVYLGFQMWRGARTPMATALAGSATCAGVVYRRGVLTNITNPKSAIFFGSVLTGLLPPSTPIWVRVVAVAICVTNSAVWHTLLAYAFSADAVHRIYGRAKTTLDRIAGTLMAALGVRFVIEGTMAFG
jgi:threonine efflux protein